MIEIRDREIVVTQRGSVRIYICDVCGKEHERGQFDMLVPGWAYIEMLHSDGVHGRYDLCNVCAAENLTFINGLKRGEHGTTTENQG